MAKKGVGIASREGTYPCADLEMNESAMSMHGVSEMRIVEWWGESERTYLLMRDLGGFGDDGAFSLGEVGGTGEGGLEDGDGLLREGKRSALGDRYEERARGLTGSKPLDFLAEEVCSASSSWRAAVLTNERIFSTPRSYPASNVAITICSRRASLHPPKSSTDAVFPKVWFSEVVTLVRRYASRS